MHVVDRTGKNGQSHIRMTILGDKALTQTLQIDLLGNLKYLIYSTYQNSMRYL